MSTMMSTMTPAMTPAMTLIEHGTTLSPRGRMTWREECVLDAFPAAVALAQGGIAGFAGVTVTDHQYSTRTGSASCSPPV